MNVKCEIVAKAFLMLHCVHVVAAFLVTIDINSAAKE